MPLTDAACQTELVKHYQRFAHAKQFAVHDTHMHTNRHDVGHKPTKHVGTTARCSRGCESHALTTSGGHTQVCDGPMRNSGALPTAQQRATQQPRPRLQAPLGQGTQARNDCGLRRVRNLAWLATQPLAHSIVLTRSAGLCSHKEGARQTCRPSPEGTEKLLQELS